MSEVLDMIKYRFISLLLFIFSAVVVAVVGSSTTEKDGGGCSTSCGLQIIRYPFRLQGDPVSCGKTDYQLVCDENNKLILELDRGKYYYVTEIHYNNSTLHIVDAKLASGTCRLPYRFPSVHRGGGFDYFLISSKINYQLFVPIFWVSFLNCSTEIASSNYKFIPCLSGKKKNTFVYFSYGLYGLEGVFPSCSFLLRVPGPIGSDPRTNDDMFQLLRQGYTVKWGGLTRFQMIRRCLKDNPRDIKEDNHLGDGGSIFKWLLYPFTYGSKSLGCLYTDDQYGDTPPLVLIVLLDIVIALTVIALLVRFIFLPLCIYVFLAHEYWKTMVPVDSIEKFLRSQQTLSPTRYMYADIIAITNHFRDKLGHGGFGSVFKGELPGSHWVAVKMLGDYSKCNGDEFINEVATIGRIHHRNVVRLVGFCSDGSKRALVYEFMPNGSLDKYIFSSNVEKQRRRFTSEKLNEIAIGIARGIDYLHHGCDMRILHFDIKPQNILLDDKFSPKVADFGLAKLCPKDLSLVSMRAAVGTIGYMAPELISRSFGAVSDKSDVYSFGMLLLEMAGGRRNVDNNAEGSSQVYYPSWIYSQLQQSEQLPQITNTMKIDYMERKLCKVGLWCIQMRPTDRPTISRVIEMLEADVDTILIPPKPFFSALRSVSLTRSLMDTSLIELSVISEDE